MFQNITDDQLQRLSPVIHQVNVDSGQYIIHEGEVEQRIFLLQQGSVEITKQSMHINTLTTPGAIIGEIATLDNEPRSASVHATQPTTLLCLSMYGLLKLSPEIYHHVVVNLAKILSQRLRASNEAVITTLRSEIEHTKARVTMGNFIIMAIILISMYVLLCEILDIINVSTAKTAFISTGIGLIMGIAAFIFIRKSNYPLSTYGFTMKNWQKSVKESAIFTALFIPAIIFYQSATLHSSPTSTIQAMWHVFLMGPIGHMSPWLVITFLLLYLLFVPLQEFIARGILQGSFEKLLMNKHRVIYSIILSNLLFSMIHIHKSLYLAAIVLIPGLIWGWLYARNPTLIGVTLSHILIGMIAFFTNVLD